MWFECVRSLVQWFWGHFAPIGGESIRIGFIFYRIQWRRCEGTLQIRIYHNTKYFNMNWCDFWKSFSQEENNNSVPNQQQSLNDDTFNHNQILQTLTTAAAAQQQHQHNHQQNSTANLNDNTNESLLALTVALRSASNISPLNQQSLRHLTHQRSGNHFTATNAMLNDKMLSPNISDLDSLTISNTNRPHRPPDIKGKWVERAQQNCNQHIVID